MQGIKECKCNLNFVKDWGFKVNFGPLQSQLNLNRNLSSNVNFAQSKEQMVCFS